MEKSKEYVILLHGLIRTNRSMRKLAKLLGDQGFGVINYNYPSTKTEIPTLALETLGAALSRCPQDAKIHFVTHSLGGILLRYYLMHHRIERLGRVVMLGPPNKGSEVVDKLHSVPGFAFLHGPAGSQLGTSESSIPKKLGPANFEVGVIAGTKSVNLLLSTLMPRPNDGKVSVESTKLEGMADHIALPVTHSFMMSNQKVIENVLHFLRYGYFLKNGG